MPTPASSDTEKLKTRKEASTAEEGKMMTVRVVVAEREGVPWSVAVMVRSNWSAWLWVNQPRVVTWPVSLFREKRPSELPAGIKKKNRKRKKNVDTNSNFSAKKGRFVTI